MLLVVIFISLTGFYLRDLSLPSLGGPSGVGEDCESSAEVVEPASCRAAGQVCALPFLQSLPCLPKLLVLPSCHSTRATQTSTYIDRYHLHTLSFRFTPDSNRNTDRNIPTSNRRRSQPRAVFWFSGGARHSHSAGP